PIPAAVSPAAPPPAAASPPAPEMADAPAHAGFRAEHDPSPLPAFPASRRASEAAGLAATARSRHFIDMAQLERAGMIDWSAVRSRVSEEFRLAQRQILRTAFTAAGAEPGFSNILMVTSAKPGEGKSFTSLNMAASIARLGDHHVLLVDVDSKRNSLGQELGLIDVPGVLDLAADPRLDAADMIIDTDIDRLSVISIGLERDRSPELFASRHMTRLIQNLGRRFPDRLLILDAAPCLSTSDPAALAPVVGQVLFLVEAERTQRDEIEASLDLIQACPTITLLLNKVQVSSRYTFGAYSSYYYSS
ncbi:MAG: hypothetical protein KGL12_15820, partial [Rhodospirillales bacterium]|nr:hypothetical protein [Rhodospirillales bacterium]